MKRSSFYRTEISCILASSLFLSSCASVGPDYEKPEIYQTIETKNLKFSEAQNELYSQSEPQGQWWKLFDDTNVNSVVEEALKANTDLRATIANLERARSAISEVQGSRLPVTNATISATRGVSPSAGSPATDKVGAPYPTMNTFDTGISANWDLDLFGRLRRSVEASRAEADAVEGLYRQTKMTVVANTVRAYTDACSVGAQVNVAKRTIKEGARREPETRRKKRQSWSGNTARSNKGQCSSCANQSDTSPA